MCVLAVLFQAAYKDQIPDKPAWMQAEQSTMIVHAAIACMQL